MLNKILLLLFTCSLFFGCDNVTTQENNNRQQNANSETVQVDETKESDRGCPEKPGKLEASNVEKVSLDGNETTVSGQLTADEALGYAFEGKEEQKLSYSTDDEFCMWVLTPNNDVLEGLELPTDGSYIVQIAIPKGAKTFELAMELRNPESAVSSNNRSQNNSVDFSNIQTNNNVNSSSTSSSNAPSLNPQEAVNLIQNWQRAKRQIFAPPYNKNLGAEFLTGQAYRSKLRKLDGSGSSVDWLENNGAYYTYRSQEVDEVTSFNNSGNSAVINVVISEERTLCINNRPSKDDNTISDKRLVRYDLRYSDGGWKISNQNTEKVIDQGNNPNISCRVIP
ncbi:ARC6/PARC6 family protein [Dactylococcopsis salina]|uniref:Plastid division protein CDP1-like IMS domain-containing protein n=1 Tax=Dactylococcopsis salina (strain PCC 8305) TaxID=13035 RepID=K9YV57_DACS8|nr:ARC6/PARC6 family protein [Dactylococcopsis salina]AFZ50008.1 hypothetical protein Dacsa_1313 [Dactylococcopsis salina PCC 8305]